MERGQIEQEHSAAEDFRNRWGLGAIRADRAYAQIALEHGAGTEPGSGQIVGLIDTGIDSGHPVFAGKAVIEHFFSGAVDETGDEASHGTAVASIIAGWPSDTAAATAGAGRGVARGADIAMFAVPTVSGDGAYVPISLTSLDSAEEGWAPRIKHLTAWSNGGRTLDFVNVSLGYHGIIEQYSAQQLRAEFSDAIAALAQPGTADKTVFVWAAGNGNGKPCTAAGFARNADLCVDGVVDARSVEILPGLPALISELRGHVIAVVAVAPDTDKDGVYEIASFSNRCGIAAEWCIAAPGARVRAAYYGPDGNDASPGLRGFYSIGGTSVAAPMVTGGLVLMKHRFRDQLSNAQLVSRLLTTANKLGIYANSAIYGQGLLDLGAATRPFGIASVALGERVDGPGDRLAETRFSPGASFGNGLAAALAGREIAAFDALGAPFWFALSDFTGAGAGPALSARLRNFLAPLRTSRAAGPLRPGIASFTAPGGTAGGAEGGTALRLGLLEAPQPGSGGGHLSLAGRALALGTAQTDGMNIAAFSTEGMPGQAPVSGAAFSWRPPSSPLGLSSGLVAERETMLGSTASGAFGRVAGAAAFVGIEGAARIGDWRIGAGAEIGRTDPTAEGGMLANIAPLTTSAFALRVERAFGRDSLQLSVAQPLRVEAGSARLSVPVGRTKDGRVLRRSLTAGLEPTGRQIEVTGQWRNRLAAGGELRLGAAWTRQPGHDAATDPDLSFLAGWHAAF